MFARIKCGVMAWINGEEKLKLQWQTHQSIHETEMKKLYQQYPASSIRQILNLKPPIDNEDYYRCRISRYFESNDAMDWLINCYEFLPPLLQSRTHDAITDMVSVYAAHAMCHAHDRMGQFTWSDVLSLLECMSNTKPARLIRKVREVHGDDFVKHMMATLSVNGVGNMLATMTLDAKKPENKNKTEIFLLQQRMRVKSLHEELERAAEDGKEELVKELIAKGCVRFRRAFLKSCFAGHLHIMELLVAKSDYPLLGGLFNAAKGGHMHIIHRLKEMGITDMSRGLCGAALGGQMRLVKWMMTQGANNYDTALASAARGNHIDIAGFMLSKGATRLQNALYIACKAGHVEMAQFLIANGAKRFNHGLSGACRGQQKQTMRLMIEKGARRCHECKRTLKAHL